MAKISPRITLPRETAPAQHDKAPRLSVLHVVSGDLWAGAEAQIFNLVAAQAMMSQVSPAVICLNAGELHNRLQRLPVRTVLLDERKLSPVKLLALLFLEFRRCKPDIIQTHRFKEHILGAVAASLAGCKVCLRTAHGESEPHGNSLRRRLLNFADRWIALHLQAGCVAVSHELGDRLKKRWNRPTHVITNSVSPEVFDQTAYPLANPSARVMFLGRVTAIKRLDILLAAANLAEHRKLPLHFDIVGDGPLREQLQSPSGNVTWHGFHPNALEYLKRADVVVLCSDHEGTPTVLIEAMALGIPVVARAVGGITELLGDGRYGHLVRSDCPSILLDAIYRVVNERDLSISIAARAQRRAARLHHPTQQAQRYLDVYKRYSVTLLPTR